MVFDIEKLLEQAKKMSYDQPDKAYEMLFNALQIQNDPRIQELINECKKRRSQVSETNDQQADYGGDDETRQILQDNLQDNARKNTDSDNGNYWRDNRNWNVGDVSMGNVNESTSVLEEQTKRFYNTVRLNSDGEIFENKEMCDDDYSNRYLKDLQENARKNTDSDNGNYWRDYRNSNVGDVSMENVNESTSVLKEQTNKRFYNTDRLNPDGESFENKELCDDDYYNRYLENLQEYARKNTDSSDNSKNWNDHKHSNVSYLSMENVNESTLALEKQTKRFYNTDRLNSDGEKFENKELCDDDDYDRYLEVFQNFLTIRAMVVLIGSDIWKENQNIKPGADCVKIRTEIEYFIGESQKMFYYNKLHQADALLWRAERLYNYVMPKRKLLKNENVNADAPNQTETNTEKPEGSVKDHNEEQSTVIRYKITVKGDDIDVIKRLKLAEKALAEGKLEKAERMIRKANDICRTENAVELMKKVAAVKASATVQTKQAAVTDDPPQSPQKSQKSETSKVIYDKESAQMCLAEANKAFAAKEYEKSRELFKKVLYFDSNADISNELADVDLILNYKRDKFNDNMKMAGEAFSKKDFADAEKFLIEALKFEENADVNDRLMRVRAEHQQSRNSALFFIDIANKAISNNEYDTAEEYLLKARDVYPAINVGRVLSEVQDMLMQNRTTASKFLKYAQEAIKNKEFNSAQGFLLQVKFLNPKLDVQETLLSVQAEIASRSSSENAQRKSEGGKPMRHEKNYSIHRSQCPYGDLTPRETARVPDEASLKDQAEKIVAEAEDAFLEKNLYKAEDLLKRANNYSLIDKSIELQNKIQAWRSMEKYCEQTPESDHKSPPKSQQDEVISCKLKAKKAFDDEDLDLAERLYEKANRMEPSEEITAAIDQIKKKKEEMNREQAQAGPSQSNTVPVIVSTEIILLQNKLDAAKYKEAAFKAIETGNIDKAEHLLIDSNRLFPCEDTASILEQVQEAKLNTTASILEVQEAKLNNSQSAPDISEDEDDLSDNIEECSSSALMVSKLIGLGLDAMNKKLYYAADVWLKLANSIHTTETGETMRDNINSLLKNENRKSPEAQETNKKSQAKICLDKASDSCQKGDYNTAMLYVIISQTICSNSGRARDLMFKIFQQKYATNKGLPIVKLKKKNTKKFKNGNTKEDLSKFMSDCYIESADIAMKIKNAKLAQEYLEKCNSLHFSVQTKKMLAEIRQLNKSADADPGFISRTLKNFKSWFNLS